MELRLDGKVLGNVDVDGETPKFNLGESETEPKRETVTVPLEIPSRRSRNPRFETEELDQDDAPDTNSDDDLEVKEPENPTHRELAAIRKENAKLAAHVNRLLRQTAVTNVDPQVADEIRDLIPDMKDEDDPYGTARTLKNVTKALNSITAKVNKLDQYFTFNEFQTAVEKAKTPHDDIFKDPKLGAIAERSLKFELQNNNVSIEEAIETVVSEMRDLAPKDRNNVKEKVNKVKKVPQVNRSGSGSSPAVTVNKPKNLQEAKDGYRAWRAARARATK